MRLRYTTDTGENIEIDYIGAGSGLYVSYGKDGKRQREKFSSYGDLDKMSFSHNGDAIKFMEFHKLGMDDIKGMVESGIEVDESDLANALICDGINSVRLFGPMYEPDLFLGRVAICFNPTIHDMEIAITNTLDIHTLTSIELIKPEDSINKSLIAPYNISMYDLIQRLYSEEYSIICGHTSENSKHTNSYNYFREILSVY